MVVLTWLILCAIIGYFAKVKGQNFWIFFFLSLLFTPIIGSVILIIALLGPNGEIDCYWCGEKINKNAKICKHCKSDVKKNCVRP